jgi:tetratricopeptide (TPR) repeat protein
MPVHLTPALLALAVSAVQPPPPTAALAAGRSAAYYHFSLGQQARMAGRFDEALDEYRKAQKRDPASGDIRAEMARLLREAGRLEEAIVEAREGTRVDTTSVEARLVLAQLYLAQAESQQSLDPLKLAASTYEEALKLKPRDAQALRELAAVYAQLGQPADAARTWQRFLQDVDPGSLEAYLQLGALRLGQGDSEGAAQALEKAVEIEPSARAFHSLGDIYRLAQKNEEAARHYRSALGLEPGNVAVRLKLADTLYRQRKLADSLAESEAVLALDPHNRIALENKGKSLRDLKRFEEALKVAEQALAVDANDLSAAYLKATVAEARRDYAQSASELERLLARPRGQEEDAQQRASNDRAFLLHLGLAYQQLGRHAEAADVYGRAYDLTGRGETALLTQRLDALVRAKKLDLALTEVRAARKLASEDPQLITAEATILREQGQLEPALLLVEGLRQRSAGKLDVLLEVAEFYQRASRYPDAEKTLVEARKVQPRDLRALFLLGAVLERQKRHDDAEAVFREALGVEPESAPVLNYLGYMNADRNVRVEEALDLIERAVAIDPENGAYLDSLGWALFRLDRLDLAEQNLRKAVAKGTNNAVVLAHLGDVLERRGNVREAVDFWRRALTGEDDDGELDRARVERKIRDAQAGLDGARRNQP